LFGYPNSKKLVALAILTLAGFEKTLTVPGNLRIRKLLELIDDVRGLHPFISSAL
jgi:hypothetical protein